MVLRLHEWALIALVIGACLSVISGCHQKPPQVEVHVERDGTWNVKNCDPPAPGNEHACHSRLCEQAHRNSKLIPRSAELLEVRQNYESGAPNSNSQQIATYVDQGSTIRAACDMHGNRVVASYAFSPGASANAASAPLAPASK